MPPENPFRRALSHLFEENKLLLFGRAAAIPPAQLAEVVEYLRERFQREAAGYPGPAPDFDATAAGWSAQVLFNAAQLIMYRAHKPEVLAELFLPFQPTISAAALISADLSLRFLPSILDYLKQIEPEDVLIPILEELLEAWPYSGLLAKLPPQAAQLKVILEDECLARLYVDRVITTKNLAVARQEKVEPLVRQAIGNHGGVFWNDFKQKI